MQFMQDNSGFGTNGVCLNWISGFCPKGPKCQYAHLKSVVIDEISSLKMVANFPDSEDYKPTVVPDAGYKVPFNKF